MKIIDKLNIFKFPHFSCFSLLLSFLVLGSIIANDPCKDTPGCIILKKFYTYVMPMDSNGKANPDSDAINYKDVYLFNDRLVFYKSQDMNTDTEYFQRPATSASITQDLIRSVDYAEIILDCGINKNKICFAAQYPHPDKLENFMNKVAVSGKMGINADSLCIVVPFMENGYKATHDKLAYICSKDSNKIENLVKFKNQLSRSVEAYHFKVGKDRYSAYNGLLKRRDNFIVMHKKSPTPVQVSVFNKGILMTTKAGISQDVKAKQDKNEKTFLDFYSFSQQREQNYDAYIVTQGLASKKLKQETWNKASLPGANPECCLYFKGEMNDLLICLASATDPSTIEQDSSKCSKKLGFFYKDIQASIQSAKFNEAQTELLLNNKTRDSCNATEYSLFKSRVANLLNDTISSDCKYISLNQFPTETTNVDICRDLFSGELLNELKMFSGPYKSLEKGIQICVENDGTTNALYEQNNFNSNI